MKGEFSLIMGTFRGIIRLIEQISWVPLYRILTEYEIAASSRGWSPDDFSDRANAYRTWVQTQGRQPTVNAVLILACYNLESLLMIMLIYLFYPDLLNIHCVQGIGQAL